MDYAAERKAVQMSVASIADLLSFARDCFYKAKKVAIDIKLPDVSETKRFSEARQYMRTKASLSLLADKEEYEDIPAFYGIRAWGSLLSFDLRKSSELAVRLGPRKMYCVLHTYMPTVLKVIERVEGDIVGLRGDGAIACFGLVPVGDGQSRVTQEQGETAIKAACRCGDAIVKTLQKVINPVLRTGGMIQDDLRVGVGIDVGEIVATRIGLRGVQELTAYGTPVNHCCKRSFGNDMVILTKRAKDTYPKKENGLKLFRPYPNKEDAFILRYPDTYQTLV
jgi:hypothetical protein